MAKTDIFRRQHETLLDLATRLAAASTSDPVAARSALSHLSGTLRVHLANEDRGLYPESAASSDPALRAVAERFQVEMGGVAELFTAYAGRWPSPAAIEAAPADFARETSQIVAALGDRIAREERDFYPLVDGLGVATV